MARHSSMLPSETLANRVVTRTQGEGVTTVDQRVQVLEEVRVWILLKAEPMGALMD